MSHLLTAGVAPEKNEDKALARRAIRVSLLAAFVAGSLRYGYPAVLTSCYAVKKASALGAVFIFFQSRDILIKRC